ncbi:hypothetical protein IHV12_04880 [Fictibacillus sp. 7GRE50]|uniref:hypothetical protein n=1 Tax=Fictibacillus sp. 7GRE50 TaxID=2745878 RepID=UPI0018CF1B82|nr:hypothetical protein [Fictibacillus sp. 7GRE50]MBH0164237.1 hypothetical protein [Fictibacillus sp. 7GRE50]
MKKLISALIMTFMLFVSVDGAYAAGDINTQVKKVKIEKVNLNKKEIAQLESMGFTLEEIESLSKVEYNELKDRYTNLNGEKVGISERYFKKTRDQVSEISKEEYDAPSIGILGGVNETTKFRLVLNVTKIYTSTGSYTGRIQLKSSWVWKSAPIARFVDVSGLSWEQNLSYVTNSAYNVYKCDGYATISEGWQAMDSPTTYGSAFKVDIKATPAPYHSGYTLTEVRNNNSKNTYANVYGHYVHVESPEWLSNISVGPGVISVTGPSADTSWRTDIGINLP